MTERQREPMWATEADVLWDARELEREDYLWRLEDETPPPRYGEGE